MAFFTLSVPGIPQLRESSVESFKSNPAHAEGTFLSCDLSRKKFLTTVTQLSDESRWELSQGPFPLLSQRVQSHPVDQGLLSWGVSD